MANDNTRYPVSVPLGGKDYPSEEKGSTKVVRRRLLAMKGSKPNRKAIVFWRGEHHAVAEKSAKEGSFEVTGKAKKADIPEEASATSTKNDNAKAKGASTKRTKVAKAKGGKSSKAKEGDSRRRAA